MLQREVDFYTFLYYRALHSINKYLRLEFYYSDTITYYRLYGCY